ncbi:hypothetical protein MMC14_002416 [Varicellaria rhodocarpa]|nr:hypothetical protein [Varicellaria rhodocarpa]
MVSDSDSDCDDGRSLLKATLAFSVSMSSYEVDLSTTDDEDPLFLTVSVRIKSSVEPSRPITVCTLRNALDRESAVDLGVFDMTSKANPDKWISLNMMPTIRPSSNNSWPLNLREALQFVTIPSQQSGKSISVKHQLKREMIVGDLATGRRKNDVLESGEVCKVQLNDNISIGWWQWGDMQGDLRDKKFAEPLLDPPIERTNIKENSGDEWVHGLEIDDPVAGGLLLEAVVEGEGADICIL